MLTTIFWALFFIIILEVFLKFTFKRLVDWLILPLIILGIIINIAFAIYESSEVIINIGNSVMGLFLGFLLCILQNFIKDIGKGDSKYFLFTGTFMGPVFTLWAGLFSFIIGAGVEILYYFYRKMFSVPYYKRIKIPFGFSILIGLLITAYFQGLFIDS